jgi:hypothetical protein
MLGLRLQLAGYLQKALTQQMPERYNTELLHAKKCARAQKFAKFYMACLTK